MWIESLFACFAWGWCVIVIARKVFDELVSKSIKEWQRVKNSGLWLNDSRRGRK